MIYNTIMNETDMSFLENTEDRFENYTMAEATAIIIGETEQNWTNFMKGVGLSELASVIEGEEVVYEGTRMNTFVQKAKNFFEAIKRKLQEITKSFINKISGFYKEHMTFLGKYRKEIKLIAAGDIPEFEFEGYEFKNTTPPMYAKAKDTPNAKREDTKKAVYDTIFSGNNKPGGESLAEQMKDYFYGEKTSLKWDADAQLKVLDEIKEFKNRAKKAYTEANAAINSIIKELDKADSSKEIDNQLKFWKSYASAALTMHSNYLTMCTTRARQAKAMCTKAMREARKNKKADAKNEGFVETDAFLGAVEFI